MAFTKTPEQSTYSTERVSFVVNPQVRDSVIETGFGSIRDARTYNTIPDYYKNIEGQKNFFLKTRPAFSPSLAASFSVITNSEDRGCFSWQIGGTDYVYTVYGDKVYVNGVVIAALTLAAVTGPVGFTEFVNSTGTRTMVMVDGTNGYVFTASATYTQIADADFPTPHVPNPVFLDGYLFLAKANTYDIYNSNLNNPALWTAGDFISAEAHPDVVVALTKINDYILAIGNNSVEYFYDVANATGTPLARHESAGFAFGTFHPETVSASEDVCVMLAHTNNGEFVLKIIEGFQSKEVSLPVANEILNASTSVVVGKDVGYLARIAGQMVYVFVGISQPFAMIYSFDTQSWFFWYSTFLWNTGFLTTHNVAWPRRFTTSRLGFGYVQVPTNTQLNSNTGAYCALSITDGAFDQISVTTKNIEVDIYSAKLDFGSMNIKFMHRLTPIVEAFGGSANTDFSIYWTDDDWYTTNSVVTLRVVAAGNKLEQPSLHQLGAFRRRAFRFRYTGENRLRLFGFEMDINKGQA